MTESADALSLPQDYGETVPKPDQPIKYELTGTTLQAVTLFLQPGHKVQSQVGRMAWMDDTITMHTKVGEFEGAMTRMLSHESLFITEFTCEGGPGQIAFTPNLPGKVEIVPLKKGDSLIARKGSFLAAEPTVNMKFFLNRDLGASLFGGLGFIMQKFEGEGNLYLEIDGELVSYDLAEGQSLTVDQGILAAYESKVDYKLTMVKGLKNIILGGEGLFLCEVTGPGKVWLQTLPAKSFANRLLCQRPSAISGFLRVFFVILIIGGLFFAFRAFLLSVL